MGKFIRIHQKEAVSSFLRNRPSHYTTKGDFVIKSNIWFISFAFPGGFGSKILTHSTSFSTPTSSTIQQWVDQIAQKDSLDKNQIAILFFAPVSSEDV